MSSGDPSSQAVRDFLSTLQDRICQGLEQADGEARFRCEEIERPGGGLSRSRVLEDGPVLEKSAVNFTHTVGKQLPPAASERPRKWRRPMRGPELVDDNVEDVSGWVFMRSGYSG